MSPAEKIALASCILLAIFLSTNVMLLPLLRGRASPRKGNESRESKALGGLLRPPVSKDAESMQELARQVEQFKRGPQPPPNPPPNSGSLSKGEASPGRGQDEDPQAQGSSNNS